MNSNNFHILRNILHSKFLKYFFLSKNIQKDVERSFFLKIQDFLGHFFPSKKRKFFFLRKRVFFSMASRALGSCLRDMSF